MNMKKSVAIYVVLALSAFMGLTSCHKDISDENAKVEFSTSQVTFDTVFTTIGSATKNFRIYNPHNFDIKVDIDLARGSQSQFSINVDGQSGCSFDDVEIPAKDSIFVHVKVNVNPNDQNTPFLITDSVVCRHGTSVQDVDLLAYGQNANFIVADAGSGSLRYKIIAHEHETVHWTNEKPYVIYGGFAAVDSLGTLIIDPGTKIYFHHGAGLWIYRYGNIQAIGTPDAPIEFRGDQLSSWFSTDYAQWDRIWVNEGIRDNLFEYVEITNAFIGLQAESLSEALPGKTIVRNSIIHNTYNSGILGRGCRLTMENCQVSNNGACGLQLQIGEYDLKHLTVANYFSQSVRKNPAVYVSNTYNDGVYDYIGNTDFYMVNSIVYGLMEDEVGLYETNAQGVSQSAVFEKCLVKGISALPNYVDCIRNQDPLFTATTAQDYKLQSGSPAIDAGKLGLGITIDLQGEPRDALPDIGAYEFR